MTSQEKSRRAKLRSQSPTREMKRFARECKELRSAMGITLREFGDLLGLKGTHSVWRYERMTGHLPSKRTLKKFRDMQYQYQLKNGSPTQVITLEDE